MKANEPRFNLLRATGASLLLADNLQKEVNAAADFRIFPSIDVEVLATIPITLLISPRAQDTSRDQLNSALEFIAEKLLQRSLEAEAVLFRGVEQSRMEQVTGSGCDVVPSCAPFFASEDANKALEYGELVMVFDPKELDKTFRKVLKSESPETLARLRVEYPSEMEMDEDWLWFSKFPQGDGRIGTLYESDYAFCIPGDPHKALLMFFLIGKDRNALRAEYLRCKELLHPQSAL